MGAIRVILKRELRTYLKSSLGYAVAAAVLLLAGLTFYAEALGPGAGRHVSADVVTRFFFNMSGLVAIAAVALSIRVLTEERQSGSLVLLRTSPVHDYEIVLGKFLAAFVFLGGMTIASAYLPLLVLVHGKISWGQLAVGYLGLLLLGSAVLSIGIFASALSRHYLAAAVTASALVGGMFLFWPLSFVVDPPLSRVFSRLAIHGLHFTGFETGVLHAADVVYYLSVVYFFLLLATKTLEAHRWE